MAETRALPLKQLTLPSGAGVEFLGPRAPPARAALRSICGTYFRPAKKSGQTDSGARKIGRCSL